MRRVLFASGVIPARKAVVQVAAQVALRALVEDLSSPGVFRSTNYNLMRFIIALETKGDHQDPYALNTDGLERLVTKDRLDGKAEDSVCDLIQVYVDARRKLGE